MNIEGKKKIMILAGSLLLLLVIIGFILVLNRKEKTIAPSEEVKYQPQFLTEAEKEGLGLKKDSRVQVFRDESGGNMTYKVIRKDDDIVLDPTKKNLSAPQ